MTQKTEIITYRKSVVGELIEFFDQWDVNSTRFQAAAFSIIDQLNNYEEEGVRLTPHVFLIDDRDFNACNQQVALSEAMVIWEGEPFEGLYEWAIKKFAPLCLGHWKLFITLGDKRSRVGLFGSSPIVSGFRDLDMFSKIRGIAMRCIAENVVEVASGEGKRLEVHFTLRKQSDMPIFEHTYKFIDAVVSSLPNDDNFEVTYRLVEKVVFDTIYNGHGFLAAVVSSRRQFSQLKFNDILKLQTPLSVSEGARTYNSEKSAKSYFDLHALKQLIHGMMLSDGITFFSAEGEILGFNGFVPSGGQKATGGARKRAFLRLKEMTEKGQLLGAYVQSQDGQNNWIQSELCEIPDLVDMHRETSAVQSCSLT